MARCTSCSAPLAANNNRCLYCGTRNDVDLHGKQDYHVSSLRIDRICPHCEIALHTVSVNKQETVYIERCEQCYGLFFDPGELETYLETSVSGIFDINLEHIKNINQDRFQSTQTVRYIKCPQCQNFMNRVNFGHRSGVIVDRCKGHGVWLDNGELTHLLEWIKAGGKMLHQRHEKKLKEEKRSQKAATARHYQNSKSIEQEFSYHSLEEDLISSISNVIFRLFN